MSDSPTLILLDVSTSGHDGPSVMLHKIEIIADIRNSTVGGKDNNTRIFMDSGVKILSPLAQHQLIERMTQAVLKAAGVEDSE